MRSTRVWPGQPYPLGATWDGKGVNFALFSAHAERVDLCLFDPSGHHEEARIVMPEYTDEVWHCYLPEARPGLLYGYRVHGPYEPVAGHRFNANKLLLDPYARALSGHAALERCAVRLPGRQPARGSVVRPPRQRALHAEMPRRRERLHLEPRPPPAHLVGRDDHLRDACRAASRSATLRCRRATRHLRGARLAGGHRLPDRARHHRGRAVAGACRRHRTPGRRARPRNYWGYNTIGYFAPDPRFLPEGSIAEFKTAVKRLHEAGIEVILDVVYNHTGEGNQLGPTLSFRGIDNLSYYRLQADRRLYQDVTGTGNTLNLDHPRVMQMVSTRCATGSRRCMSTDSASTCARRWGGSTGIIARAAAFFDAMRQDPVMAQVKLIAEPWDVGPFGYQLGNFPPGWAEWNGQYRDGVRRFWKGDKGLVAEMASRLAGSSDIFGYRGRRPWASINFVTAHDGYTLQDLVSYERQAQRGQRRRQPRRARRQFQLQRRRRGAERRSRRSSRSATGRSAISWRRCCCRWACRCCWPATNSGTRSTATTTPIARTTKSPGSIGRTSAPRTRRCATSCAT